MAIQTMYIGSFGPFIFDDADLFRDGSPHRMHLSRPPILGDDVLRLTDIGGIVGAIVQTVPTATIADPIELNALAGFANGAPAIVAEIAGAALDRMTLYAWDSNPGAAPENPPYTVDGAAGSMWIAISGLYVNQDLNINGNIIGQDDFWIGIGAALERIVFDAAGDIAVMGANLGVGTLTPTVLESGIVVQASSTTGGELILERVDAAIEDGDLIGGLIFKNTDASGVPPHYVGIKAVANNIFGAANLEFYAGRTEYEANVPQIVFSAALFDVAIPTRLGDSTTNYIAVSATGDLSFEGSATVWNDIYFPMSSGKIGGANQPSFDPFQGNIEEYTFGINDYIHLPSGEILHSYEEGTDIPLHCHIVTNGSDVADTQINYEIEYTIGDINEVMSAAAIVTSGNFTIPGGTADRTHLYIGIDTIAGAGYKIGSAIKMRFRRIARVGGTADPTSDPFVLMVGIHIEEDTVGSRTETIK